MQEGPAEGTWLGVSARPRSACRWGSKIAGRARDGAVCLPRGFWVGTDFACVLSGMEAEGGGGGGRGMERAGSHLLLHTCSRQPLTHCVFNPHQVCYVQVIMPTFQMRKPRLRQVRWLIWSQAARKWRCRDLGPEPGRVHGAWPNAGGEKCRRAEEGELAQGPPDARPRGSLCPPTGLRRPARDPVRSPLPGRGRHC